MLLLDNAMSDRIKKPIISHVYIYRFHFDDSFRKGRSFYLWKYWNDKPAGTSARVHVRLLLCALLCACMSLPLVCVSVSVVSDRPRTPVNKMWPPQAAKKLWEFFSLFFYTSAGHAALKRGGRVADNKLAPSCLPPQMLRLGFNCGTWAGKQRRYRQNSDAGVSGRVVNSSHNTSVSTVDTEPATFAPLPCSRWIRIWHKFCTYKISKCHCSRS